ncbi:MAG: DUF655 domain-containing protein [Nitrososphaeria archaeon]
MQLQKKYESIAYVLDFKLNAESVTVRGKRGTIIQSIGSDYFMLLELLGMPNASFVILEKVNISKEKRDKILSVLGRLKYEDLSPIAKNTLPQAVELIVRENEQRFVSFFNMAMPVTPRLNSLELIPGIGKTLMNAIIKEKEKKPFSSFKDIEERIGLKDPAKKITERIIEELKGNQQIYLFVKQFKE